MVSQISEAEKPEIKKKYLPHKIAEIKEPDKRYKKGAAKRIKRDCVF